ncbi:MAG: hypothetical protein ACI9JM_001601 [Halioglobus sp.]
MSDGIRTDEVFDAGLWSISNGKDILELNIPAHDQGRLYEPMTYNILSITEKTLKLQDTVLPDSILDMKGVRKCAESSM